ncbi:MAG: hypothetical protein JO002_07585 [Burkholderiaceae bacterium]|nr:hypothetical protein [Burkholderiaceae bacterium]
MIYVLGMSHAINVLKAAAAGQFGLTHENWSRLNSGEQFFDLPAKPELVRGGLLRAFVISHATGWGSVAEMRPGQNGQRHVVAVDGYVRLLESLSGTGPDDTLFSFVHGNEHSILSLVQHAQPYDFFEPWDPGSMLAPGSQPIAFDIVRQQMEQAINSSVAALAMLRSKLPQLRVVHVMAPPPIESEEHIRNTPEVFRERIEKTGITPLSIRLKYYRLAQRMLGDSLQALRIDLLACPEQAIGPTGAIKDDYAYGATHGNERYGELVLRQMTAIAG